MLPAQAVEDEPPAVVEHDLARDDHDAVAEQLDRFAGAAGEEPIGERPLAAGQEHLDAAFGGHLVDGDPGGRELAAGLGEGVG